jgi:Vam6/Vps39-like protein vacuolar protein sorting-associated protein 39
MHFELAEAVHASFTASSNVGPEPSPQARLLLKQYLEAVLGLSDFDGGGNSGWPFDSPEGDNQAGGRGSFIIGSEKQSAFGSKGLAIGAAPNSAPAVLSAGTALLCLVCSQLSPPNAALACRAAKLCAERNGLVLEGSGVVSKATIQICELVAEKVLREASSTFSLLTGSSPLPIARASRSSLSSAMTDFAECATWLVQSCGRHERGIEVSYERLQQQAVVEGAETNVRGCWSQIKFESYTATHLSEIWNAGHDNGCRLVLSSPATMRLLESNPRLGLSVFTASHPQNESQWRAMLAKDPLARAFSVLQLLKSANPPTLFDTMMQTHCP